ncbi:MAG TPA: PASTA domain-containing protein [Thermoleophilaceae bacterium]|nr:PASTA domain-containing protein [Thermoleophilaceae bacterium]
MGAPRALAVMTVAALACAPAAGATTVRQSAPGPFGNTTLVIQAGPAEANAVTVRTQGFAFVAEDAGAPVTAGPGCVQAATNRAECTVAMPPEVNVDLGDGNDGFAIPVPSITFGLQVSVAGGPGSDALSTATQMSSGVTLDGGDGDDLLVGGYPAQEQMSGGPGNDQLRAQNGDGDDVLSCGPGVDAVTADRGDGIAADCENRPVFADTRRCVVPQLRGAKLSTARRRLSRAGCRTGAVRRRYSRRVRKGRVIASAPKAGSRRATGTKVRLSVSRGRRR